MIDFIKSGKTNFKILLPACASVCNVQAASELALYILKSTGVVLETVREPQQSTVGKYFSIGKTELLKSASLGVDYTKLNGDGFVISSFNGNIITDAETDRGFLYSVYEFLEKYLGVKFFAPDETYVPNNKDVVFENPDILSAPAFRMRTFLIYPVYGFSAIEEYMSHTRTVNNWHDLSDRFGGKAKVFARGMGAHNARYYVPAEKYGTFESTGYKGVFNKDNEPHPEFYHCVENRKPDWDIGAYMTIDWANGITADGKLDESMNVSVAKIVIEEMKKDVLANPNAEYFIFEQEDAIDPITDKVLLEKYTASGVIVRFCNVIAREVQKWADKELNGRKVKIVTFAYNQTRFAPVRKKEDGSFVPIDETVVPADNLYIYLAYVAFQYYAYDDPRQLDDVRIISDGWRSICKHFWFWGYDSVFTDFYMYNPSIGCLDGTVRLMRDMGVEYFLMQSSTNAPFDWQAQMKSYVWMKKLWNPELDTETLLKDYIDGYYGKYAGCIHKMRELFDPFYDAIVKRLPKGEAPFAAFHEIGYPEDFNKEIIEKAISLIETEEEKLKYDKTVSVEDKTKYAVRLARAKITPLWMQLKYFKAIYGETRRDMSELASKFCNSVISAGNIRPAEGEELVNLLEKNYGLKN